MEQERLASEQKLHPLRESINARLKEQEARIIENQFDEHLKESEAPEEALIQALGKTRPAALQAEINRLNNEISSLGAVNLGALEELQSSQARKGYLDSQLNDLKEASETLQDAIRRIDAKRANACWKLSKRLTPIWMKYFPPYLEAGRRSCYCEAKKSLIPAYKLSRNPLVRRTAPFICCPGVKKP